MDKEKIIHAFLTYSKISREAALEYDDFFELAISEVTARMRPDVDTEENSIVLCHLCGTIAYYKYTLLMQIGSSSEIKMADVTVKSDQMLAIELAKKLRDDALSLAAELLVDDFCFVRI